MKYKIVSLLLLLVMGCTPSPESYLREVGAASNMDGRDVYIIRCVDSSNRAPIVDTIKAFKIERTRDGAIRANLTKDYGWDATWPAICAAWIDDPTS